MVFIVEWLSKCLKYVGSAVQKQPVAHIEGDTKVCLPFLDRIHILITEAVNSHYFHHTTRPSCLHPRMGGKQRPRT